MRPAPSALALALLLLFVLPASAAEARWRPLSWSPDPVPPDTPVEVRFAASEGARNATLQVCLAEDGNATVCFVPVKMTPAGDGTFTATTDARYSFPAGQQVGLNVTWVDRDGVTRHHPEGIPDPGRAYVFFTTTAGAPREAPAGGFPLLAGAALAGALILGPRFKGTEKTP